MVRHTGEDFVDEERIAVASVLAFQSTGIDCSKLDTPQADRLSGYSDASFSEQIFNIPMAEVEFVVEPDCVTDDVGWESMTPIGIHGPILAISAR